MLEWTSKDRRESQQQGWLLTFAIQSNFEGYQIERFDEAAKFENDFEAVVFVLHNALIKDDPLAKKAVRFIKENNGRLYK